MYFLGQATRFATVRVEEMSSWQQLERRAVERAVESASARWQRQLNAQRTQAERQAVGAERAMLLRHEEAQRAALRRQRALFAREEAARFELVEARHREAVRAQRDAQQRVATMQRLHAATAVACLVLVGMRSECISQFWDDLQSQVFLLFDVVQS